MNSIHPFFFSGKITNNNKNKQTTIIEKWQNSNMLSSPGWRLISSTRHGSLPFITKTKLIYMHILCSGCTRQKLMTKRKNRALCRHVTSGKAGGLFLSGLEKPDMHANMLSY